MRAGYVSPLGPKSCFWERPVLRESREAAISDADCSVAAGNQTLNGPAVQCRAVFICALCSTLAQERLFLRRIWQRHPR
jgi:hypothetical protein